MKPFNIGVGKKNNGAIEVRRCDHEWQELSSWEGLKIWRDRNQMETKDNYIENCENYAERTAEESHWLQLEELFTYGRRKGDSALMQCRLHLLPVVISAYRTSASNLKKTGKKIYSYFYVQCCLLSLTCGEFCLANTKNS